MSENAVELMALVAGRAVEAVLEKQRATLRRFGCQGLADNMFREHWLYLDREATQPDETKMVIPSGFVKVEEFEDIFKDTTGGYAAETIAGIVDEAKPFWMLFRLMQAYLCRNGEAPLALLWILKYIDLIDWPVTLLMQAVLGEYPLKGVPK